MSNNYFFSTYYTLLNKISQVSVFSQKMEFQLTLEYHNFSDIPFFFANSKFA